MRNERKKLIRIDWTYDYVPMLRNQKNKQITIDRSYKAIEGTIEYALDEHMMSFNDENLKEQRNKF